MAPWKVARRGPFILSTTRDRPWTGSGVSSTYRKAAAAALGIEGVNFHDLRGTFEMRAWDAGCSPAEPCAVTGRALPGFAASYCSRTDALAKAAITRIERTFGAQDSERAPERSCGFNDSDA